MEDKNNLKFINNFTKIKVSNACKFFGYNQSNLSKGKCGRDAEAKVRKYIEYELALLLLDDVGELAGELECQKR